MHCFARRVPLDLVDEADDTVEVVEVLETVRNVAGGSGNDGARYGMLFINGCPPSGDGMGSRKLSGSGFTRPGVVEIVIGRADLEP